MTLTPSPARSVLCTLVVGYLREACRPVPARELVLGVARNRREEPAVVDAICEAALRGDIVELEIPVYGKAWRLNA